MTGHEALKSAVMFLTGVCMTALLFNMPAQAADTTGYGGFKVSDPSGSHPVRPPPLPRPPPPPADPPGVTFTKDGDVIIGGGPEKGGSIATKDGTLITKDFITTEKETGGGARVRTRTHRKTGMKGVCTLDPDGSVSQETRDRDGGVISRVGWGKNGKLTEYEPWANDQIFDSAQRVLEVRYRSVGGQTTVHLQSPGKAIHGGSSILVRSDYREWSKSSPSAASEDIRLKTEVRKLKFGRDSRLAVTEVGEPMQASGWGKTRDEAIANALEQIASQIRTDIRSETIDYQASTRSRTTKGTTESSTESFEQKLDARSKAAFKTYRVVAITRSGDRYTVNIEALPGAVVSWPSPIVCGSGYQ
ncbi:MAG: LPP20 family lipoprotein [Gammaproteobacteria bacterium]|nr:LPP20 family lipoprotein [Gammaproteobacteria bacterium]